MGLTYGLLDFSALPASNKLSISCITFQRNTYCSMYAFFATGISDLSTTSCSSTCVFKEHQ